MIISVVNAKGGTSKTTSSINLACYFGSIGKKVLFLDLDPQCNSTKFFLKIGIGRDIDRITLWDILYSFILEKKKNRIKEAVVSYSENIDLVPASLKLETFKEIIKSNSKRPLEVLKEILKPIKDNYDYIIIDCAPDLSVYFENAIELSDFILLPSTFDLFGIDGLSITIPTILEIKGNEFNNYRVFFSLFNSKATKIQDKLSEYYKQLEELGAVFPVNIPLDQSIKNAQADYMDIFSDPKFKSKAKSEYENLGKLIMELS